MHVKLSCTKHCSVAFRVQQWGRWCHQVHKHHHEWEFFLFCLLMFPLESPAHSKFSINIYWKNEIAFSLPASSECKSIWSAQQGARHIECTINNNLFHIILSSTVVVYLFKLILLYACRVLSQLFACDLCNKLFSLQCFKSINSFKIL